MLRFQADALIETRQNAEAGLETFRGIHSPQSRSRRSRADRAVRVARPWFSKSQATAFSWSPRSRGWSWRSHTLAAALRSSRREGPGLPGQSTCVKRRGVLQNCLRARRTKRLAVVGPPKVNILRGGWRKDRKAFGGKIEYLRPFPEPQTCSIAKHRFWGHSFPMHFCMLKFRIAVGICFQAAAHISFPEGISFLRSDLCQNGLIPTCVAPSSRSPLSATRLLARLTYASVLSFCFTRHALRCPLPTLHSAILFTLHSSL